MTRLLSDVEPDALGLNRLGKEEQLVYRMESTKKSGIRRLQFEIADTIAGTPPDFLVDCLLRVLARMRAGIRRTRQRVNALL